MFLLTLRASKLFISLTDFAGAFSYRFHPSMHLALHPTVLLTFMVDITSIILCQVGWNLGNRKTYQVEMYILSECFDPVSFHRVYLKRIYLFIIKLCCGCNSCYSLEPSELKQATRQPLDKILPPVDSLTLL